MAAESKFERHLTLQLERRFPGAIVLKNNAGLIQGFPDRLILFESWWAAFEVKPSPTASHRPNQDYYIDLLNRMSYANFVYPQNEEEFYHDLQQTFRTSR